MQFLVVGVAVAVVGSFVRHRHGQIDAGLVGEADEDKQHIGHFVSQIGRFRPNPSAQIPVFPRR